jgi:hypothetical protein
MAHANFAHIIVRFILLWREKDGKFSSLASRSEIANSVHIIIKFFSRSVSILVKSSINQGSKHTVQHCNSPITWKLTGPDTPAEYCGIKCQAQPNPGRPGYSSPFYN